MPAYTEAIVAGLRALAEPAAIEAPAMPPAVPAAHPAAAEA